MLQTATVTASASTRHAAGMLLQRVRSLESTLRPTPVVQLDAQRVNLFAKLEGQSLVGSVKDRAAFWMLRSAIMRGDIVEGSTIIESSSGNFALALAYLCRELGLRFIPVIDPNVSRLYESRLLVSCDTVVKVTERDDTGGFLKTRLRKVAELRQQIQNSFWPNQYANTDIVDAHYRFTAKDVTDSLQQLDYAFIGVGTGGTIAGVSRRLKERFRGVKIVAVDAEGSVIFGGAPRKRHIPGLGSSIVPVLVRQAEIDDVIIIPETETVRGCRELLSRHGLFLGGSSGTVFAAVNRYFAKTQVLRRQNVLFLCPDGGKPYMNTIYSDDWARWLEAAHAGSAAMSGRQRAAQVS
ncbi:MAG TPA: 2,3-diaminopropionate biosynthesis protein SbnA [Candidatus Nanopelagicales bacterium]|nr:2,3-diaminopropionate biosynthesis protein SbnA [Candidatus Nanopelagicales bacterium]